MNANQTPAQAAYAKLQELIATNAPAAQIATARDNYYAECLAEGKKS